MHLAGSIVIQVHLEQLHRVYSTSSQDNAGGRQPLAGLLPVHNVGQEVVVPQPVLRVHLLVVDRQGPIQDAPLLDKGSGSDKRARLY